MGWYNLKNMMNYASWTRRLKIRHLEIFSTLVSSGSQSAAADMLNMTQPALSKWLRELEQDIGAPLFLRGKTLRLTTLGVQFLGFAEKVLGEAESISDRMEAMRQGRAGRLRIGVLHAVVSELLPTAILRFRATAPKVSIAVTEDTLVPLLDALLRRELDVVIGRIQGAVLQGIRSEELYEEQVVAVVRASHPLRLAARPNWAAAREYPWLVTPQGTPMRTRFESEFVNAGVRFPEDLIESRSVVVNETLLRHTDMITLFSRHVAPYYTKNGVLTELALPMTGKLGPVGLYFSDDEPTPTLSRFAALVRELATNQAGPAPLDISKMT
ncbi:LysR substrate-binding domain-containing protein [Oceanibacterium hippocampi]|uniref:HTH-type transcriptional regulator GbpR n=1 Tax=Oceanibacterium hippocampi TaxID=745714 RepID=A0A1Y5TZA2_9PROT|nr:LysR substrate-binding domain-containing protein [Oceanibacterium hippocampi]SLN76584.1 HTH-type transcriptional regulator GbpR [Oceanibacterium hippocampi]